MLDGVLPVDKLNGKEISRDAIFVGAANRSPTMPVRSCANVEFLGVGESCKLLLMYNGAVCVRGPRGNGDARQDRLSVVSRHPPTSQGLFCRPRVQAKAGAVREVIRELLSCVS